VNRADAYFGLNDKQHALDDYNEAIRLSPQKADLYYNRGVYYGAQGDAASALKDYDAALRIDPKLVPALQKRAKSSTCCYAFAVVVQQDASAS